MSDRAETTTVSFTVAGFMPVTGKGRLLYLADATVEIAGIELALQGLQVVQDRRGRLTVRMPNFRHPSTGMGHPAVVLPVELEDAIAAELLALVPGARVCRLERPEGDDGSPPPLAGPSWGPADRGHCAPR